MPIYEYEPVDHDCLMCTGTIEVLQGIADPVCKHCPHCGMDVKKVVSRAAFAVDIETDADKAAKQGFTTYRRSEFGVWEKTAGSGDDYLVGSDEDKAQVLSDKAMKPAKILDLDKK